MCRVYCDGILVPGVSIPDWVNRWSGASTFRIILNINRAKGIKLDLARQNIASGERDWNHFVRRRCLAALKRKAKQVVDDPLLTRAFQRLCRLLAYGSGFSGSIQEVIKDIPIPLIVLDENGHLAVIPPSKLEGSMVNVVPTVLAKGLSKEIFDGWGTAAWPARKSKLAPWHGSLSLFADGTNWSTRGELVESVNRAETLLESWLAASACLKSVSFLFSGEADKIPLIQEAWLNKKGREAGARDESARRPGLGAAIAVSLSEIEQDLGHGSPKFVEFCEPFSEFFTAGWQYVNVQHPLAQALAECIKAIADHKKADTISGHDLGRIRDALQPLFGERRMGWFDYLALPRLQSVLTAISQLLDLTSKLGLFEPTVDCSLLEARTNVPAVEKAGPLGAPILSLTEIGL